MEIKELQKLLKDYIGSDKTIVEQNITNLTAPGENYGSVMLSVEVKLKNINTNEEETAHFVAKTPPDSEFAKQVFNVVVSVICENEFYKTIIPTLQNFQKSTGISSVINYFPKYIGSRISLNDETDVVDDDAVLLLENLKLSNFFTANRFQGFDFRQTQLVLKNLANFHATVVAVKLKQPNVFEDSIKKYLRGMEFCEMMDGDLPFKQSRDDCIQVLNERNHSQHVDRVIKLIKRIEKLPAREPFATIVHNDLWLNNIMLKNEGDSPSEIKIIDFQSCKYGSPADDLLFFLFTSVTTEILRDNLDTFLQYYYKIFIKTLKDLKCDITKFTMELFEEELRFSVKRSECTHCLGMLYPIFKEKTSAEEIKNFKPEMMTFTISELHKDKLCFIVNTFVDKGWI